MSQTRGNISQVGMKIMRWYGRKYSTCFITLNVAKSDFIWWDNGWKINWSILKLGSTLIDIIRILLMLRNRDLQWRIPWFKNQSLCLQTYSVLIKVCNFMKQKVLPLTISWAKLETPEPRSDWVTQRYKSWSVFVTSCNLKEAANLLWLMFFVWATGMSSPLRLCKQKPIFRNRLFPMPSI